MKEVFCINMSALSELFWETTELFTNANANLLDLRTSFLHEKAQTYAQVIKNKGAPLHECVDFIDCTKIGMCRPGGHGINQRSV